MKHFAVGKMWFYGKGKFISLNMAKFQLMDNEFWGYVPFWKQLNMLSLQRKLSSITNYALRITNYEFGLRPINPNLKSWTSHKKCRHQAAFLLWERITCSPCSPWCSRTAGSRCRSWSCKQTGRKSGTRRSHPSLRSRTGCGSQWSWYASWWDYLR